MQHSQKQSTDIFDASQYHVGIVCAQFNNDITKPALQGAREKLEEYNVPQENITVHHVAGSVEIPVVLHAMAQTKTYDCLVAIGAIIKGETDHYDYVAKIVTEGILRVMLDNTIPVGFGVLTTPNKQLAQARISIGAEATEAALRVVRELKTM